MRATNFANELKNKVRGNCFHASTLVSSLQSEIHVTIEFLLIFGEANFVEVSKIHEIREICSLRKRHPTVDVCFINTHVTIITLVHNNNLLDQ